jgi:hypothetical protein
MSTQAGQHPIILAGWLDRAGRPGNRMLRTLARIATPLLLIAFAVVNAQAYATLFAAGRSGDWNPFWRFSWGQPYLGILFALIIAFGYGWDTDSVRRIGVDALHQLAATGDDTLAPPASVQPDSLSDAEMPTGPEQIGPLRGLFDRMRVHMFRYIAVVLPVLATFYLGLLGMAAHTASFGLLDFNQPDISQIMLASLDVLTLLFAPVSVTLAVICWRRANRIRSGLIVNADRDGISWRDTRRNTGTHRLAWAEADAFFRVNYRVDTLLGDGRWHTAYVLASPGVLLSWHLEFLSSPADVRQSERFTRLIAARTRLPLRDLSEAVEELSLAYAHTAGLPRRWPLDREPDPRWVALVAPALAPFKRGMQILTGVFLVPISFLLLAGGLGWLIQQLLPH